ncbi:MAG TPA: sensor histidine kinase [Candidatus Polarisedimenticolia bacterium]|jgi:signal transduction histidine kinase|nr:sensor histidine kinase [Candidatus Polarisedimenticolia bacterium]
MAFLLAAGASHRAVRQPADLGLRLEPCAVGTCVDWVMPAGYGWHRGVRPGMRVLSVDGGPPPRLTEGRFATAGGTVLSATVAPAVSPSIQAEMAMTLVGLAFALLAAAVLVRRPAAPVARLFALFGGLAAVTLAVAPAAGGPHPPWALVVQFVSLLALAAALPSFAVAFVGRGPRRGAALTALRLHRLAAGVILAGYLIALVYRPATYGAVRVAFGLFLALSILAAIALFAVRAAGSHDLPGVADARLALGGIACGALPFVVLTLVPSTLGYRELVPWSVSACLSGIIPAAFAYAILRHHLLGIRRLVHRGMVNGIATCALLVLVAFGANAARLLLGATDASAATVVLVVLGALLFDVMRRGVRNLLDRLVYRDPVDSQALLADVKQDLLGNSDAGKLAETILGRLQRDLGLEAAALFLGAEPEAVRVAACTGTRAQESIAFIEPRLGALTFNADGFTEVRWDSDVLVVAGLLASSQPLGYLVLGPKEGGEVFLEEERLLISSVAPILSLAIREATLLTELREASGRLIHAEETERTRIARDLHDGPLQKAILLGGIRGHDMRDTEGVARELVVELRELCARLRPAILDDLGLVSSIDWLLEQASRQFAVEPSLTLSGMSEDDRLAPEEEVALFRVTQEAVTNAVKHGRASSIHVSLARRDDSLELRIRDDGAGFSPEDKVQPGLGIPGMRERLRQIGGGVTVTSGTGRGTVVTAFIPRLGQAGA